MEAAQIEPGTARQHGIDGWVAEDPATLLDLRRARQKISGARAGGQTRSRLGQSRPFDTRDLVAQPAQDGCRSLSRRDGQLRGRRDGRSGGGQRAAPAGRAR
ncbi:MAG: hypothetical protein NW205_06025 [Hyphomicrobiaceae bacterium]|nr:hypothetical protein [Hyphomicrobiaceae bacterium]